MYPKWQYKPFLKKVSAIFLGGLVALLLLEFGIRVKDRRFFKFENVFDLEMQKGVGRGVTEQDPQLGLRLKSNYKTIQDHFVFPHHRYKIRFSEVSTTPERFRSSPNTYGIKLRKDYGPILTLGDSFTFGAEVNDNETWPSHLQNFSKTTVLNGGVVGFGLDQTYLLFEELITQNNFKPSWVIISLTPLNIERTHLKGRFKYLTGEFVPRPFLDIEDFKIKQIHYPDALAYKQQYMYRYTRLDPVRRVLGYSFAIDSIFKEIAPKWWWNMHDEKKTAKEFRTPHKSDEVSQVIIKKISELAKEKGFKLLIVRQDFFQRNFEYQTDLAQERVVAWCKEQGLLLVDLHPKLKQLFYENTEKYRSFFLPSHMTNQGNLFVAQEIWNQINQSGDFSADSH